MMVVRVWLCTSNTCCCVWFGCCRSPDVALHILDLYFLSLSPPLSANIAKTPLVLPCTHIQWSPKSVSPCTLSLWGRPIFGSTHLLQQEWACITWKSLWAACTIISTHTNVFVSQIPQSHASNTCALHYTKILFAGLSLSWGRYLLGGAIIVIIIFIMCMCGGGGRRECESEMYVGCLIEISSCGCLFIQHVKTRKRLSFLRDLFIIPPPLKRLVLLCPMM